MKWRRESETFDGDYERARLDRTDGFVEEMTDISDDSTNDFMEAERRDGSTYDKFNEEAVSRSKLRIETRKWIAGRMNRNKYGDSTAVTGPNGAPLLGPGSVVTIFGLPDNGRDPDADEAEEA